jgi:hypothetical protein
MHSPVHAQSDRDPGAQQQPDSQRPTPRRNRVLHATIFLQASPTLGAKRQRGLHESGMGERLREVAEMVSGLPGQDITAAAKPHGGYMTCQR